jgi:hypothetical protein
MGHSLVNTKNAYVAILLLGIVSLLGDVVYEGSRGIVTPYLEFLGASAFAIAFFGRFGEFLGYFLRLVSGRLADTTRAYWIFIFLGVWAYCFDSTFGDSGDVANSGNFGAS